MKAETISIHGGYHADPQTKSVAVPIYQTVAYAFDSAEHGAALFNLEVEGNIYTRLSNPTNAVLEQRLAALESGMGALTVAQEPRRSTMQSSRFVKPATILYRCLIFMARLIPCLPIFCRGRASKYASPRAMIPLMLRNWWINAPAPFFARVSAILPPLSPTSQRSPKLRTGWAFPWSSTILLPRRS